MNYSFIAAGHRRMEASADTVAERLHWQFEAERFELLAAVAVTDPSEARSMYRPTCAYEQGAGS